MAENNYRNVIFDASALIAVITQEAGHDQIKEYLSKAVMSSVNVSEVYQYCLDKMDMTEEECKNMLKVASVEVYEFTEAQAMVAAKLVASTKKYGISIADRACLSLSIVTGFPVLTCDRIWQKLDLDIKVLCPR